MYAYFGDTYINGATVTNIVDPNLSWEVVKEYDLGIEFSLFGETLEGELDYYHKKAEGALYTVPLPTIGFGSQFLTNAADIINTGVEVSLRWNKTITPEVFYRLSGNVTFNKNRVENIGLGRPLNYGSLNNGWTATQTLEGQPIGSFWVFETDGIFQTQDEVTDYPHVANAQAGDFKILDQNDDGIIDNEDRIYVGSYQPKVMLGISNAFTYKKFDFSMDIYGVFGNKVYNAKKGVRYGGNYNIEYEVAMNRWIAGSNNNEYPRAFNGVPYPTDYFIESGTYIKISDISLGYDLTQYFKTDHIERFRVYFSAQNPYVFTKYSGFTPELPGNQNEAGIELNIYPVPASYVLGINLQIK
jgi:outer membrane receptor protein involved in Fe transport